MTITQYGNGIGATTGDSLALCKPLMSTADVWYVDYTTGVDAVSPAGKNREKPLKTFAQALTNATDYDIVVFLDGHAETFTGLTTISSKLTLIGEGSSAGVPTVSFTNNQASGSMFTITATNVQFRNIKIKSNAQTDSTSRVRSSAARTRFIGCYFECGATDTGPAVLLNSGANYCDIKNCTFISTATLSTAQPESALKTGAAITDLTIEGTVFSAGTVGFSNFYAVDFRNGAVTSLCGEGVSLLLGADMTLNSSTVGYMNVQTCTGGSRVNW